jgi:hypothetical protein
VAEIKSALELALEKAERYGKASREELAAAQYQEQGRQLAVKFLKGEGDLDAELRELPPQAQEMARVAIKEVFLRNISLPRNGEGDERLDRALAGLMLVAVQKREMARLKGELQQLLQQFLQIRNNAVQQLKARFSQGVNQMQRAMEAKTGQRMRVESEHLPQFQEEWRRFYGSLQDQFEPMLDGLKDRMLLA